MNDSRDDDRRADDLADRYRADLHRRAEKHARASQVIQAVTNDGGLGMHAVGLLAMWMHVRMITPKRSLADLYRADYQRATGTPGTDDPATGLPGTADQVMEWAQRRAMPGGTGATVAQAWERGDGSMTMPTPPQTMQTSAVAADDERYRSRYQSPAKPSRQSGDDGYQF